MDFELVYLEFSDPMTKHQKSGFFIWTGKYYLPVKIETTARILEFNEAFKTKEVIIDKEGKLIYDKD